MSEELSLSVTEAGLLTVAERRGQVTTARKIDSRNDPISVERRELLERLHTRGMLVEASRTDVEIDYAITDHGRAALAALDALRPK
jgi:hypothetical protein